MVESRPEDDLDPFVICITEHALPVSDESDDQFVNRTAAFQATYDFARKPNNVDAHMHFCRLTLAIRQRVIFVHSDLVDLEVFDSREVLSFWHNDLSPFVELRLAAQFNFTVIRLF